MEKQSNKFVQKLIVLLAMMIPLFALAQDNQSDDEDQAELSEQSEQQVLDTELTPEELAAAENNELVLDNEELVEAEEEGTNSRFIPTEQISQDLGVSFPVDI